MRTSAKNNSIKFSIKHWVQKKVRSHGNRYAWKSTFIKHQKSQKNNIQHQKSKTFEKKICKRVDGVRKFTVKSTTNPYKRFRSKKRGLWSKMCQKSYLKTNIHRYVAKTESQQRAPYLHIATGQSKFLISISVSGAIDEHFFTFSEKK